MLEITLAANHGERKHDTQGSAVLNTQICPFQLVMHDEILNDLHV